MGQLRAPGRGSEGEEGGRKGKEQGEKLLVEKGLGEQVLQALSPRGERGGLRVKQLTHSSHSGVSRSWGTDATKLGGSIETNKKKCPQHAVKAGYKIKKYNLSSFCKKQTHIHAHTYTQTHTGLQNTSISLNRPSLQGEMGSL